MLGGDERQRAGAMMMMPTAMRCRPPRSRRCRSKAQCRRWTGAVAMAELAAAYSRSAARQSRADRLLDLLLHQLPARSALRPTPGRRSTATGPGGHRRPFAGIRLREEYRNVEQAVRELNINYPVARQRSMRSGRRSAMTTGRRITSSMRGRIRHHHFGEGDYDQSEQIIQRLLAERDGARTQVTSSKSPPAVRRPRRTWPTPSRPKPISATIGRRILPPPRDAVREHAACLCSRAKTHTEPVGPDRRLDHWRRARGAQCSATAGSPIAFTRGICISFSGRRRRQAGTLSRHDRRPRAGRQPRRRRRRARRRHSDEQSLYQLVRQKRPCSDRMF